MRKSYFFMFRRLQNNTAFDFYMPHFYMSQQAEI